MKRDDELREESKPSDGWEMREKRRARRVGEALRWQAVDASPAQTRTIGVSTCKDEIKRKGLTWTAR